MPELISLPMHSVDKLRPETIELAQRLDALIANLSDTQGFATLTIEIKRGIAKSLDVTRHFKLDSDSVA